MGEVWKAHDARLDRIVAIKLLLQTALVDATTRERFHREALVLSRLSHSGLATVFDFDAQDGYDFLVMEYVGGGTLESRIASGQLSLDRALHLGAAIAEALENAHRHGVLHRDLKPGNVMLTAEGEPKILDFGLAMLLTEGAATGRLTQTGMILGSLPYMSPEQLFGEADNASTDIYAMGVMLFEMVTGQRPFNKPRPEALMFAIINNAPPSVRSIRPDAPAALDQLVSECLQKDPAQRPASAALVAASLRSLRDHGSNVRHAPPANRVIRAIAVLPFRNVSRDVAQEYFADGITEAIIADLAQIRALRVISRTSAMRYKGTTLSLPEIARELNVDAVLEGSALLLGNRVRVTVQLVSASADTTLWSDRYDRDLEDVLGLQSELAETVAREIAIQLTPTEATQLAERRAVNPEAHLELLKSRHSFFAASPQAVELALRHARRALELDPTLAAAWSVVADCHAVRALRGMAPAADAIAAGTAAARKALELDPLLADAHAALGVILSHSGDLVGGLHALRQAIQLNPGLPAAHDRLGRVLYAFEHHAEAIAAMTKAVSLDPLSMFIRTGAGDAYYFAREYEKSVVHYRMALELDSRFDGAHTDLARSLEALGRFDEARAEYEEGRRLSGGVAGPSFGLAHVEAASGNVAAARRILAELTEARGRRVVSAWGIAALHASLGDADDAFRWLDVAIDERASGMILLRVHPRLDPIRTDPRYRPLVRRVGLESISA